MLSPDGDFLTHPQATDDMGAAADADVVFLGLKAYSLPGVADALHRVLRPRVPMLEVPGTVTGAIRDWLARTEGSTHHAAADRT